jgi:hypothetical protein
LFTLTFLPFDIYVCIYIRDRGADVPLSASCCTEASRSLKLRGYWQGLPAVGDCSRPVGGIELS